MKSQVTNFRSFRLCAGVAIVFLTLSYGMRAHATSSATAAEPGTQYLDPNGDYSRLSVPEALQLAYQVLQGGNHNYNGHRVAAMKGIRRAAKLLGVELEGDGGGHEEQSISDSRFYLAQRLLELVRSRLAGEEQESVGEPVDQALKHLSKGLQIRAVEEE